MSQILSLSLNLPFELFQLEELAQVRALAKKENAILYCWKTTNISNWLEKGISISDVLGIVVLPKGLPEQIDLPDDSRKAI